MRPSFSRIATHVLLAAVVALAVLLGIEWLLPGAVTTSMPLYALSAVGLVILLAASSLVREAPVWKRVLGVAIVCLPLAIAAIAFAYNEGQRATTVGAGLTVLLLGVLIVGVGFGVEESHS